MEDVDKLDQMSESRYVKTLRTLHETLSPRNYFEIGTLRGETLALAKCRSVSVDPFYQIASNIWEGKPSCFLYQTTSDRFFEENDLYEIMDGPVEMAFLDGMHLFEFLLRDFINTEAHCKENSVIAMHDCLPPTLFSTFRLQHDPRSKAGVAPHLWAGDVWKVVPILRKYRPELRITVTNCKPTGLIVITGLNPGDTTLADNYGDILQEFKRSDPSKKDFEDYWNSTEIVSHDDFNKRDAILGDYWL